jgi:hypothetical protein
MNPTVLTLPMRTAKPRETGLTMVIDGGIPLGLFTDLISLGAEYIDTLKFGWGTALVTNCLREKIKVLAANDIDFYFGGTLFEKFALQGRFEDYRRFCDEYGARHVEVSNGTIEMSNSAKAGAHRTMAGASNDGNQEMPGGLPPPRPGLATRRQRRRWWLEVGRAAGPGSAGRTARCGTGWSRTCSRAACPWAVCSSRRRRRRCRPT